MTQVRRTQRTENDIDVKQTEIQGLCIENSHDVTVAQTEVQGLLLVQAALQAAIEAAIIVLGTDGNKNIKQLQSISQSLEIKNFEKQTIVIKDSDGIAVTQTELQIDVVVQAAINLLAKLLVQIG
ncbi:spore coat protein [Neobacillus sp. PS3-40]|uniref:spore coat protein n=1 Tax=Neobacillus sp. PS3-40 TaxID=3070679 RepID=UPI0027E0BC78|nr:spore coat protein [Neobacillus sp. PS3-40]WML44241.1 spore coat protein [Neobacillus sp. PS3-40]